MIFIDRSVPKGVAAALKEVRDDVRWFEDEFDHDTKDTVWLPEVGRRGWIVISRDKKIRTRPAERQALLEARAGCFILTQKQHPTRWDYLKLLAATLDEMISLFTSTGRPFIFGVGRTGQFKRIG